MTEAASVAAVMEAARVAAVTKAPSDVGVAEMAWVAAVTAAASDVSVAEAARVAAVTEAASISFRGKLHRLCGSCVVGRRRAAAAAFAAPFILLSAIWLRPCVVSVRISLGPIGLLNDIKLLRLFRPRPIPVQISPAFLLNSFS